VYASRFSLSSCTHTVAGKLNFYAYTKPVVGVAESGGVGVGIEVA
jgi:hypothetical protein